MGTIIILTSQMRHLGKQRFGSLPNITQQLKGVEVGGKPRQYGSRIHSLTTILSHCLDQFLVNTHGMGATFQIALMWQAELVLPPGSVLATRAFLFALLQ